MRAYFQGGPRHGWQDVPHPAGGRSAAPVPRVLSAAERLSGEYVQTGETRRRTPHGTPAPVYRWAPAAE